MLFHIRIPADCWQSFAFYFLGTLERHETGEMAKAILTSFEDSHCLVMDSILPVSQDSQRHKNAAYKSSSSYKLGALSCNLPHAEKSSDKVRMNEQDII